MIQLPLGKVRTLALSLGKGVVKGVYLELKKGNGSFLGMVTISPLGDAIKVWVCLVDINRALVISDRRKGPNRITYKVGGSIEALVVEVEKAVGELELIIGEGSVREVWDVLVAAPQFICREVDQGPVEQRYWNYVEAFLLLVHLLGRVCSVMNELNSTWVRLKVSAMSVRYSVTELDKLLGRINQEINLLLKCYPWEVINDQLST